jgi:hypothetical protein
MAERSTEESPETEELLNGRRATIGTSKVSVQRWDKFIADLTLDDPRCERLVHNAYPIN